MSYKYYLEMIRGGLYEEFYEAIQTGMVCATLCMIVDLRLLVEF